MRHSQRNDSPTLCAPHQRRLLMKLNIMVTSYDSSARLASCDSLIADESRPLAECRPAGHLFRGKPLAVYEVSRHSRCVRPNTAQLSFAP